MHQSKNILIFTAHPDDHICAAGTLMLLKDKGFMLHEIVATAGEKGVWWDEKGNKKIGFAKEDLSQERAKELSEASKLIGIETSTCLNLKDSEITRDYHVVEKIIEIVRLHRPEIVFAMHPTNDYHHDHREIGKFVTEAVYRASWSFAPELGSSYTVPTVLYMEGFYFIDAHVVVDITPYFEKKKKLLDVYASQIEEKERQLLYAMNTYRSFSLRDKKVDVAEAFEIPKEFPMYLNKLSELFS